MAKEQLKEQAPKAAPLESAGVEDLIGRLRDQGTAQGRSQADALVSAAQLQASNIIAAANRDGETVSAKAKQEAGKLKAAGEDAVRLALRDTILALESDLLKEFENRLRHLVKAVLVDPAFLQQLILGVASEGSARDGRQKKRRFCFPPSSCPWTISGANRKRRNRAR